MERALLIKSSAMSMLSSPANGKLRHFKLTYMGALLTAQRRTFITLRRSGSFIETGDGTFELFSESIHGPNEWTPTVAADEVPDVGELAETSISLEQDFEEHLVHHLDEIENGLRLVGPQMIADVGPIDILAGDAKGIRVVSEAEVSDCRKCCKQTWH